MLSLSMGQYCAGWLPTDVRRLRGLEDKNNRLKRIIADVILDREILRDVLKREI